MSAPHIHEVAQDYRIVRLGYHLIGKAGILDSDLSRHLVLLKHVLLRRFQGEVELLFEQLHAVHFGGNLVALCAHDGGQVILHLIHKSGLFLAQLADDVSHDLRCDLVGICGIDLVLQNALLAVLFLIGLDVAVEYEAAQPQVVGGLLTL